MVGCSDGLTKLKSIFNKGRNVINHEEIRLPYRNGILHGRDFNYANEYVSCKCVSLMFALADWMNMKDSEDSRKAKYEKETNPPPISESLKKMHQNAIAPEEIYKWKKRDITIGTDLSAVPSIDDGANYPYVIPLLNAFSAWERNNYGKLSMYFKNIFSYESSAKKRAGECRKMFQSKNFVSFEIKEIEERSYCLSKILVQLIGKWEKNCILNLWISAVYIKTKMIDLPIHGKATENGYLILGIFEAYINDRKRRYNDRCNLCPLFIR